MPKLDSEQILWRCPGSLGSWAVLFHCSLGCSHNIFSLHIGLTSQSPLIKQFMCIKLVFATPPGGGIVPRPYVLEIISELDIAEIPQAGFTALDETADFGKDKMVDIWSILPMLSRQAEPMPLNPTAYPSIPFLGSLARCSGLPLNQRDEVDSL